tara:strand:+ start:344 stop:478 length:135 start_codon:yes stop_codon:yes gene_type:complete
MTEETAEVKHLIGWPAVAAEQAKQAHQDRQDLQDTAETDKMLLH